MPASKTILIITIALSFLFIPFYAHSAKPWGEEAIVIRSTDTDSYPGEVTGAKLVQDSDQLWVVWLDNRNSPDSYGGQICVQSINHHGIASYTDGIILQGMGWCPSTTAFDVVPDNQGGIYVCATDVGSDGTPKVIQHYNSELSPTWAIPHIIENLVYAQSVRSDDNNGILILVAGSDPSMLLLHIDIAGNIDQETVFEVLEARSAYPIGIVKRTNGFMALGQIVWTANTSGLRSLLLSSSGNLQGINQGILFYQGNVLNPKCWDLNNGNSLLLFNGPGLSLYGQYFGYGGEPMWDYFEGHQLFEETVSDLGVCPSGDGFWLQYRRNDEDPIQECLQRYDSSGLIQLYPINLTSPPESNHTVYPQIDGYNGMFAISHMDEIDQPAVIQFDQDGEIRTGYENPVSLDNTGKPAKAINSINIWTDMVVAYLQDREDSGRQGLYLQRFTNAIENDVIESADHLPQTLSILSSYPNPFNAFTTLEMKVQGKQNLNLSIFNMLGQRLTNRTYLPENNGIYSVPLDFNHFSSGTYYVNVRQGESMKSHRITLLK